MFNAIVRFRDLQDNGHMYHPGDSFPRDGLTVSDERIAELSGNDNRMGYPLIAVQEQAEETPKKPPGRKKRVKKDD